MVVLGEDLVGVEMLSGVVGSVDSIEVVFFQPCWFS